MKKIGFAVAALSLVGALAAVPAVAEPLSTVYTNVAGGSYNTNAWNFTAGFYSVTDSFTLSSSANLSELTFAAWVPAGDTLTSVDWAITSQAFGGTVYGSGTQFNPSTGVIVSDNGFGYDVDSELASISGVSLGAGSYWIQLSNGGTADGNSVFWDESDGASSAFQTSTGSIPSESFTLYASQTPEPSSFLLLGSGLAGFAGLIRRKIKA